MSRTWWLAVTIQLAACAHGPIATQLPTDYQREFSRLDAISMEARTAQFPARLAEQYAASFSAVMRPGALSDVSDADLQTLHAAASMGSFYLGRRIAEDLQATFAELVRRNLATRSDVQNYRELLVRMRLFAEARSVSEQWREWRFEPLPVMLDRSSGGGTPRVMRLDGDPSRLVISDLPLDDRQIVVIASPNCGFSIRAMNAIAVDPRLREILARHSIWVVPAENRLGLAKLSRWNSANPDLGLALVYDESEYPFVTLWQTPVFLFLTDGKVVGEVVGWPDGGNRTALLKQAEQLGLVHADTPE